MRNRTQRAFTLIEILIVVVILGILAAIVIPQFTDASQDAQASSVQSQLQTVRGQIELYNVQIGSYPDFATNGWDDLVTGGYLQGDPRNAARSNAVDVHSGAVAAPGASGGAAADGWYWNTATEIMYAIDSANDIDGDGNADLTILDF